MRPETVLVALASATCVASDAWAACAAWPDVFAKVRIESCQQVTFRASSAKSTSNGIAYFRHRPGSEYTAALLSIRVESSELRWRVPPPHPTTRQENWTVGSLRSVVMDGTAEAICGAELPKTLEVVSSLGCCDVIPTDGGVCLVPRELPIVREAPRNETWYPHSARSK